MLKSRNKSAVHPSSSNSDRYTSQRSRVVSRYCSRRPKPSRSSDLRHIHNDSNSNKTNDTENIVIDPTITAKLRSISRTLKSEAPLRFDYVALASLHSVLEAVSRLSLNDVSKFVEVADAAMNAVPTPTGMARFMGAPQWYQTFHTKPIKEYDWVHHYNNILTHKIRQEYKSGYNMLIKSHSDAISQLKQHIPQLDNILSKQGPLDDMIDINPMVQFDKVVPYVLHSTIVNAHEQESESQETNIKNDNSDTTRHEYTDTPPPGSDILFYIHGGAWVMGTPHSTVYTELTLNLAKSWAQAHNENNIELDDNKVYNPWVCSVHYGRAPNEPYPQALYDLIATYQHIQHTYSPRNIIISGDSAGGNLSVALSLALQSIKDSQQDIYPELNESKKHTTPLSYSPMIPSGLVLISPALDLTPSSFGLRHYGPLDPVLPHNAYHTCIAAYLARGKQERGEGDVMETARFIANRLSDTLGTFSRSYIDFFKKYSAVKTVSLISQIPISHEYVNRSVTSALSTLSDTVSSKVSSQPVEPHKHHADSRTIDSISPTPGPLPQSLASFPSWYGLPHPSAYPIDSDSPEEVATLIRHTALYTTLLRTDTVSPVLMQSDNMSRFPPTTFILGTNEMLFSDSIELYRGLVESQLSSSRTPSDLKSPSNGLHYRRQYNTGTWFTDKVVSNRLNHPSSDSQTPSRITGTLPLQSTFPCTVSSQDDNDHLSPWFNTLWSAWPGSSSLDAINTPRISLLGIDTGYDSNSSAFTPPQSVLKAMESSTPSDPSKSPQHQYLARLLALASGLDGDIVHPSALVRDSDGAWDVSAGRSSILNAWSQSLHTTLPRADQTDICEGGVAQIERSLTKYFTTQSPIAPHLIRSPALHAFKPSQYHQLAIFPGMFHVFPLTFMLPEAQQSYQLAGQAMARSAY